jgi:hypothetical protein
MAFGFGGTPRWMEIVGVVGDIKHDGLSPNLGSMRA